MCYGTGTGMVLWKQFDEIPIDLVKSHQIKLTSLNVYIDYFQVAEENDL